MRTFSADSGGWTKGKPAAWGGGLARLGLARISAYLYLSPVFGTILSGVLLGQWLSGLQVAGGGAVLGGVALTQWAAWRR